MDILPTEIIEIITSYSDSIEIATLSFTYPQIITDRIWIIDFLRCAITKPTPVFINLWKLFQRSVCEERYGTATSDLVHKRQITQNIIDYAALLLKQVKFISWNTVTKYCYSNELFLIETQYHYGDTDSIYLSCPATTNNCFKISLPDVRFFQPIGQSSSTASQRIPSILL